MRNPNYAGNKNAVLDMYLIAKSTRYAWGFIDHVDVDNGTMNVRVGNAKVIKGIIINFGSCGPYHGVRVMPRKKDMVLLGYEHDNNMFHIATIPFKYHQWHENEKTKGSNNYLLHKKLQEGEVEIAACDQSGMKACSIELLGDGTIQMNSMHGTKTFKAGASSIDEGYHSTTKQDRSRLIIGQVERKNPATGENEIKAFGGVPYTGTGDALNETIIKVGQPVGPDGEDLGTPTAAIKISDQLLDDTGVPIVDKEGQFIQCDIQMKSGAHITINAAGKININEANPLVFPVKKVARNGDEIDIAIGSTYVDAEHPNMTAKAIANIPQMVSLAGMILSPIGPCIYVPIPGINPKLSGEIVEGAKNFELADDKPIPIPV